MAIDRAAVLRNAEKLIRQGKLEAAISEYARVVEESPEDWSTANLLGDLYARAGQTDKAVERFIDIAAHLADEGALSKAAAVYKKILKLKPDHEHVLVQLADLLASQGLYADARVHLTAVVELRRRRGDVRGTALARVRLGSLDPEDLDARRVAASARVEIGDTRTAVRELKEIASALAGRGRTADAIESLREAARLDSGDEEAAAELVALLVASGDFDGARASAATPADMIRIADALEVAGRSGDAIAILRDASGLDPANVGVIGRLARALVSRGEIAAAAECLPPDEGLEDRDLLMLAAEIRARSGAGDEAIAIAARVLDRDPSARDAVASLGCALAGDNAEIAYRVVQLAADLAIRDDQWGAAVDRLRDFITRVPTHVPALLRLVEITVDGGLPGALGPAQAQLADAYIAAGAANEARFIAEDLVTREPWVVEYVDRARRALALAGEADPDARIAELLSEESPFSADALSGTPAPPTEPTAFTAPVAAPRAVAAAQTDVPAIIEPPPAARPPAAAPAPSRTEPRRSIGRAPAGHFELDAADLDLESILRELEGPASKPATSEPLEVDLSSVLGDISNGAPVAAAAARADLNRVFAALRDRAERSASAETAAAEYRRAEALHAEGDVEGAMAALKVAAKDPSMRFGAASRLGRMYLDLELVPQAIEWLERAAQAPAPAPDQGYDLLYDLADALEREGESARALAVLLELDIEAGAFRDVAARIERLRRQS